MTVRFSKTMWGAVGAGSPHPTFDTAIPAIAREGWDGVVFALIALEFDRGIGTLPRLAGLCAENRLDLVVMVMTNGVSVADHLATLRAAYDHVAPFDPSHVVCHGGLDRFTPDEASLFYREALAMEQDFGLTVAHETHRSRIMFTPWATARVLDEFATIRLAVDLSHWMVVAERPLDDELETIRAAGSRMIHLDARVGYEEGPQVPDPLADEWSDHRAMFERWWDQAIDARLKTGCCEPLVVVPEYGPPPYQQTVASEPTTDLWETCLAMRRRWMERAVEAGG
ncbi:hypothetical protein HQ535_06720 [bacterium]|nr:hypothetical protein [bacterium]